MAEKSRPQELVAPGASHQRPETQERSAVPVAQFLLSIYTVQSLSEGMVPPTGVGPPISVHTSIPRGHLLDRYF